MPSSPLGLRRSRAVLATALLVLTIPSPAPAAQAVRLTVTTPVERELAGGGTDTYALDLTSGQYLSLVVDQRGIDVVLSVVAPSGKQLVEVDSPNGTQGPESVLLVTDETGAYSVVVRSPDKTAAAGRYEVRVVELRASTPNDAPLIESAGLYNQSMMAMSQGRYKEAIAPAEKAIAIREKTLGPDDPLVADAVDQLGLVNLWLANMSAAEPLYLRALAIREKAFGPDHLNTAESLYRLAALYLNKGEFPKAEEFYGRSLAIREKAFGPDHSETANIVYELGFLYQVKGDLARAESFYRRSLTIREKTEGPDSQLTALSLKGVAGIHMLRREYATAEPLYQRVLAIQEKTAGPNHPDVAETIRSLSWLSHLRGDEDTAASLGERGLAVLEKTLGPNHPNVAGAVGDLAEIYFRKKDYAKAEAYFLRSLDICEKAFGANNQATANALSALAFFYNERAQYAKAEPLLQRSIAIFEKTFGPDSPRVVRPLNNLAFFYARTGETAKAGSLYERTLAINEKTLGPDHPDVGLALSNLTGLVMRTGDVARAVRSYTRATDISERNIDLNLTTGSERQKLLYLATLATETETAVSLHVQFAPDDPAACRLALRTVLRRKGRALDAMADGVAALRRRMAPGDQALLDRLTDARSRLSTMVLRGPGRTDPATYQAEVKRLGDEADRLEAEVSGRSAAFRAQSQPVTIEAVQSAIPTDAALVEFVRYRPVRKEYSTRDKESGPPRYAAYVLGREGEPRWVDLGEAEIIDKASEALRDALRDPKRTDAKLLARAVDEKVMQPVRALLGPTRRVLLSPDGELNLIPFAALVNQENRYLVEQYSFTYLTSGRDLVRLQVRPETARGAVIVADPDFGGDAPAGSERKLVIEEAAEGAPRLYFGPLPGTAREARAIQTILPDATLLIKAAATETSVKQVRAPKILHIATHGFFLRDQGGDSQRAGNPLARAGLGLAGANRRASDGDDDGVLTALEAAGLDLWGTKLVVLSACDTGVGEVRSGEGVYGLRRALVLAGSESQVMSLWPVSDQGTRELMAGYYRGLQSGEGRGEALRQVQLRMLRGTPRRHPYYWASFIESGDWSPLDDRR